MADAVVEKKSPKTVIFNFLKNNTMLIALVAVMVLFEILMGIKSGEGFNLFGMSLFSPSNITNIINQNAYVVILATGMLLCILTGGNIDLSVGSYLESKSSILTDWIKPHCYLLLSLSDSLLRLVCYLDSLSQLPL